MRKPRQSGATVPVLPEPGTLKACPRCQRVMDALSNFHKDPNTKDGLDPYCKSCHLTSRRVPEPEVPALSRPVPALGTTVPSLRVIPPGVLNGIKIPDLIENPSYGVWCWYTPKGWRVVSLYYASDPKKRPGTAEADLWIAKRKASMSTRDWLREMEMDATISEGQPFFTTFVRAQHVQPLTFDPSRPLVRGWDFGRGHPAIVWAQLNEKNKLHVLRSAIETQKNIFQFAPWVIGETNTWFPGAKCVDYGDPSGAQETDKGATTVMLLDQFKIKIHYRFSFVEEGLKIMEQRLLMQPDGQPGLLINHTGNLDLINGFAGGYMLDIGASGKDTEGRLKNSPKKDGWFEHCMDALRYLCLGLFTIQETVSEEQAWAKVGLWRTNEAHAAREADKDPMEEFCG